MRGKPSSFRTGESESFDLAAPKFGLEPRSSGAHRQNASEDVIGEIGLVLVVILGGIVAINIVLAALHVG